ncbi:hypothetical protein ACT2E5_09595 [Burkholderia vietnamiensis]|uniref:hypothetical protein n=1 Tax=Burkholderia vietnamiensis TaxID=60552 RepID=UPI00402AA0B1
MQQEVDAVENELSNPELEVDVITEVLLSHRERRWFNLGGRGELYLRRSRRILENEECEGLDIANVGVKKKYRRNGVFSNAVSVVEEAAARMALGYVHVEAIMNPVLIPALQKRGYTVRRTRRGPVNVGEFVLPAQPDEIDAYKLIGRTRPQ